METVFMLISANLLIPATYLSDILYMRWTSSSSESEDRPNSQAFMCAMTTIQHGQNKNPETDAAKQNSGVIYFSIYTCDFVTRRHSQKRYKTQGQVQMSFCW